MRDPVIATDGHTYDRAAIERWLVHHNISPKVVDVSRVEADLLRTDGAAAVKQTAYPKHKSQTVARRLYQ